jgi:hypothetical protein
MDASDIERLTMMLFERLNNTLYRQQGLAWAAKAASDCGLRLEIRGNGWEKHPTFAAFARGPVRYGGDLESLTRAARFNLVLEPYFPTTHQRYLDAAVAGGLCLVRRSSSLPLLERWQRMVAVLDERISTLDDARRVLEAPGGVGALGGSRRRSGTASVRGTPWGSAAWRAGVWAWARRCHRNTCR